MSDPNGRPPARECERAPTVLASLTLKTIKSEYEQMRDIQPTMTPKLAIKTVVLVVLVAVAEFCTGRIDHLARMKIAH
ncbi:hypothetical protein BN2476_300073 [Paraburkholderia piptadeniae]|uniref:Uncharacterized protein n=1 Tax=Paraburkholderia piptadeniae TaxID=1701573 RepID=A0A1N7S2H1_9BURK|nr:hypothetical protein [Paraburkholderia piptadeniae]SIT41573.1 hypothetical protein BN2476_300073 [Paraburkholderia piptadeniae]